MKRTTLLFILCSLSALAIAAQLVFTGFGRPTSLVSGTYVASQVDTVAYTCEGTEAALYFYIHPVDSVSLTNVIVRRVFHDKLLAVQAGDTILPAVKSISNDSIMTAAVSVTPLATKLLFRVDYAASGQGVTTPSVTYGIVKRK